MENVGITIVGIIFGVGLGTIIYNFCKFIDHYQKIGWAIECLQSDMKNKAGENIVQYIERRVSSLEKEVFTKKEGG